MTDSVEETTTEKKKGTVKWFSLSKGYGFISPEDGSEDIFVHISNLEKDDNGVSIILQEGDVVEYETETTDKGLSAVNVKVISTAQETE